jgi:hypothetical protein
LPYPVWSRLHIQNEPESLIKPSKSLQERLERRSLKFQQYLELVEGTQSYAFRIIALIFLVGVEVALFFALFYEKPVGAGLLISITIIAVLPILVIRVFDISVLNLSKEGVQAEMLRTEMNEVLSKVDRLFALTMSESLYEILSSIAGNTPKKFTLDENLRRQLYYLADIGYIEFNPIAPLKEVGEDLREHVNITRTGKDFLELRPRVIKG